MKKDNNDKDKYALKNLALISQIGISVITPILLGVYIGQFIDKKVGTNGVFSIILIVLGAGAGFLNIFKLAGSKDKKSKDNKNQDNNKSKKDNRSIDNKGKKKDEQ